MNQRGFLLIMFLITFVIFILLSLIGYNFFLGSGSNNSFSEAKNNINKAKESQKLLEENNQKQKGILENLQN